MTALKIGTIAIEELIHPYLTDSSKTISKMLQYLKDGEYIDAREQLITMRSNAIANFILRSVDAPIIDTRSFEERGTTFAEFIACSLRALT